MNRFSFSSKFLVAATFATMALGAATTAHAARPEVFFSVGLNSGPAWVEPARSYYVQPERAYVRPPVFVAPRPVFVEPPRFGGYGARGQWEREQAWRRAEWRRHEWRPDHRGWDRDHDRDDHGERRGHRN